MSTAAPLPSPVDPQDPKVRERLGRAFLVGLQRPDQDPRDSLSLLDELRELVANLGIEVRGDTVARLREEHPRHLVGTGKMEEITALARGLDCGLVVFDDALTPAQQRNWEKDAPGLRVIDRQEVILDIFAARAKTREAVLQVELARLQQQLPRLRRLWSHLDRQRGGGAMQRDAGETQLEMDQRGIREKIARVRRELEEVVRQRATQRKQRQRVPVPTFAIVGYTNAGKSSLLNRLTGAEVLAEDRLFATLDPTTRRLTLPSGRALLLTDTVGFVRRLPHRLVEAFKATLEESVQADVLLHVVDAASPDAAAHAETTLRVLGEVGAGERPVLTVLNKADLVTDPLRLREALARHPGAIAVSARTGEGVDRLLAELDRLASQGDRRLRLLIPHDRYDLVAKLHGAAAIVSERATDGGVELEALVPARLLEAVAPFAQKVAT